ncbi:MAG: DUF448 domain-containing protein [Alphaproteobacteria bacterium]|nr:DUF448 domain-containing protein [Alphaproteobacteria bacterium]
MKEGKVQRCALTGEELAPSDLLRFVLSPEAKVVFDRRQDLPGKAVWIAPRRSLVEEAISSSAFDALGERAQTEGLSDAVARQLRVQALSQLNLIRRSGALVGGFEKVKDAITSKAVVLLQASDAAPDGKAKLAKLASHHYLSVVDCFTREELSAVTGQENQAHIALLRGGLTDKFNAEVRRYLAFEQG